MAQPILSIDEYEALPHSIRRKCFSSLERLRIAEHHAQTVPLVAPDRPIFQNRFDAASQSTCSDSVSSRASHPVQHASNRARQDRRSSPRRPASLAPVVVTRADAERYLALPEKVRRAQFSKEEQELLETKCTALILERLEGKAFHQEPGFAAYEYEHETSRHNSMAGSSRDGSAPRMGRDSFQEQDAGDRATGSRHGRKYSLRRNFAMPTVPIGRTSTSSAPSALPSPLLPAHRRSRNSSLVSPLEFVTTAPGCDATALHYQDPEARMKLRQYLASPQKFDEAIEFGFPASAATQREDSGRRSAEPTRAAPAQPRRRRLPSSANDAQTFLRHDDFSFLDNSDADSEHSGSIMYQGQDRSTAATTPADDLDSPSDSDSPPASPRTPYDFSYPLAIHPTNPDVDKDTIANLHAFVDRVTASKFANIHEDILPPFTVDLSSTPPVPPLPTQLQQPTHYEPQPHPVPPRTSTGIRADCDLWDEALAPGGREMTMRMTLTRPDLRADEDVIYGWRDAKASSGAMRSGRHSPSASYALHLRTSGVGATGQVGGPVERPQLFAPMPLEALPMTDDATGEHGAFAVKREGGLVKRMLRRVRKSGTM